MRTIYDYKDIRKLEQSLLSEELRSGVIVTATASLAIELRAYYPDYKVIGMHELVSELVPEWDESTKDLRNYISLRNSLDNYAAEKEDDETLFISLQRNAADMWNAILLLVEADVYPHDIPDSMTGPVGHFKEIWRRLEVENSTLMNLRAQFAFRLSNPKNVIPCIESCVGRLYKSIDIDITECRFFFLGFYFITPIQARILDILSHAGIDIAYLNCHDTRYRIAGEIWEKTFKEEYEEQSYKDIQPELTYYNSFGEILNGNTDSLKAEITNYSSALDFAQAMKTPLQTGASIFTPDLKGCEKIIKEYYPECFKRKHLLAFPVGQYIYYLHMMWNASHGQLELRYDYVYKCFASGWLEVEHINGREYLYELSKLEPYFKNCITYEEWRAHLHKLKSVSRSIQRSKLNRGSKKRWHELLGSPLERFSIFSLPVETLDELEKLLTKLSEDAEFLFSSTGKVRISDHFTKIVKLINSHMDREDVLDDEIQIAKELIRSLDMAGEHDQECPINAIRDAIVLLIGGRFDESDSLDQEISLLKERIAPLSMVESSLLSNYGEDIYLVLADEFTLPGKQRELPWPLTDVLLDSLQLGGREDTKRYIMHMRSVIKNRPLSYRYLFFSFISNVNEENHPEIHINWIKNQDQKTVSASPYVMMWPDATTKEDRISMIDFKEEIDKVRIDDRDLVIEPPSEDVPEVVSMDYELCEYRYLYSYLVNYLPEYNSDFHYQFLLTSLIKVLSNASGRSKEETAEELFKLFPFFRNIEQRQALDYCGKGNIEGDTISFDGVEYTPGTLDIHFLKAKDLALYAHRGGKISDYEQMKKLCMYCPYSNMCIYKIEKMNRKGT